MALVAGGLAALVMLVLGINQPGRWMAEIVGAPMRGYDVYIHDRYLIVQPVVLLVNIVVFGGAALAVIRLARRTASGREGHSAGS